MHIYHLPQPPNHTENLKKTKIKQKQKAVERHGCNHLLLGGHCFHPLQTLGNSTGMQEESRTMPESHKASSVGDLHFHMTLFSCGFAPFCAVEKRAGLSNSEQTSDNDYILTQEFLQPQERGEFECLTLPFLSLQKGFLKTMKMLLKCYQAGRVTLRIRYCFWKKVKNMLYLKIPR